jgi:hypothetical protein
MLYVRIPYISSMPSYYSLSLISPQGEIIRNFTQSHTEFGEEPIFSSISSFPGGDVVLYITATSPEQVRTGIERANFVYAGEITIRSAEIQKNEMTREENKEVEEIKDRGILGWMKRLFFWRG